jgi:hypothetical protein
VEYLGDGTEGGERGRVDIFEYILVYFSGDADPDQHCWFILYLSIFYFITTYNEVSISGWGRKEKVNCSPRQRKPWKNKIQQQVLG